MVQEAADEVRRRWGCGSNTTNDPGPWEGALRNPFRRRFPGAQPSPDLGSFKTGCAGDASILNLESGAFDYVDSTGELLKGTTRIAPRGVVIHGKIWHRNGEAHRDA